MHEIETQDQQSSLRQPRATVEVPVTAGRIARTATRDPRPAKPGAEDVLGALLVRAVATRAPQITRATLQRTINIGVDAYARGQNPPVNDPTLLNTAQLNTYLGMAVVDDYKYALALCTVDQDINTWKALWKTVLTGTNPMANRIVALRDLVGRVNTFLAGAHADMEDPDAETRYQTDPQKSWSKKQNWVYTHTPTNPQAPVKWDDDPDMRRKIATGLGPIAATLPEVAPSGALTAKVGDSTLAARVRLKQLSWAQAKTLLPRPLLNLIFDVRYQLDTSNVTVGPVLESKVIIDQRTAAQKGPTQRTATPNQPGTLRSWHTDSPGVLPANNFNANAIPPHATDLHAHYTRTSQSGAGSSQTGGATAPVGYAEYTGTGSNTEHNTKIVLDYINKRVYLTLSHYQYWALVTKPGPVYEFLDTATQDIRQAEAKLKDVKLPDTAVLMSPWMEIVMP